MNENSVPTLVVALVVTVYWARVLQLVVKTRRRTGKSANFLPPEKLGRLLRILWIPVVGGWIIFPLLLALGYSSGVLRPVWNQPALAIAASAVAVLCLGLTWICWQRMGRSWRMGINPNEKTQLIVTGPYAYVRHPIYALSTLLMVASVVAAPSPAMFVCGVIHIAFVRWEARREERYLLGVHGEIYARYLRAVGGFMPRAFTPFVTERV